MLAHLLAADGHDDVVGAACDGEVGLAEGGRAGRAGVGDVDDGDAGLADLLQDALAEPLVWYRLPAVEGLDVLHFDAGVLEGFEAGLGAELGQPSRSG